jgi:hypothetical protein
VEVAMREDLSQSPPEPVTISREEADTPAPEIKLASTEVEKIGDRMVKVQFIEYTGKRKKKVTHIEVREDELEEMLKGNDKPSHAQFALF